MLPGTGPDVHICLLTCESTISVFSSQNADRIDLSGRHQVIAATGAAVSPAESQLIDGRRFKCPQDRLRLIDMQVCRDEPTRREQPRCRDITTARMPSPGAADGRAAARGAERDQRASARIHSPLDRHPAHRPHHVGHGNGDDRVGGFTAAHLQPVRDSADGLGSGVRIKHEAACHARADTQRAGDMAQLFLQLRRLGVRAGFTLARGRPGTAPVR